ncbi:MAG: oligosaccharide flippase family protein [Thermoproteota archaeon]
MELRFRNLRTLLSLKVTICKINGLIQLESLLKLVKEDKGLAYTTIGNVGSALLGALFWLILASVLKVSEYGEVNYYMAFAAIPAAIGFLGLNTTVTTYLAKGEEAVVYEANLITLLGKTMSTMGLALSVILAQTTQATYLLSKAKILF